MAVLVDTSVWSLALRRSAPVRQQALRQELDSLILEGQVVMMGAVRQELLSGIRENVQFVRLRNHLRAYPDLALTHLDHEEAAAFFNVCRTKGIQGSNTDFLLCAAAARRDLSIFTTDQDFVRYATVLPIRLHASQPG